jgi:hypothetical protein
MPTPRNSRPDTSPNASQNAGAGRRRLTLLAAFAAIAVVATGGALAGRQSPPETPSVAAPSEPVATFDQSVELDTHLGQRIPAISLTDMNGGTVNIDPDDGRPAVVLLVTDNCAACSTAVMTLTDHLQLSEYDPRTSRYDLHLITIITGGDNDGGGEGSDGTADWLTQLGWPHPAQVLLGDGDTVTHFGFGGEQLPAWTFIYPDGTLAGRELGEIGYDTYRLTTTLLAATIP